ncbi:hypothetical protein [Mesorhizobium sp.]|uniref:hypothetical protein n=1 Tax=Mesorhizobium sp. TaxID=1871066 RepID=UPI0025D6C4B7|nr:hypothetical protein [Mesorhizobium sp.]
MSAWQPRAVFRSPGLLLGKPRRQHGASALAASSFRSKSWACLRAWSRSASALETLGVAAGRLLGEGIAVVGKERSRGLHFPAREPQPAGRARCIRRHPTPLPFVSATQFQEDDSAYRNTQMLSDRACSCQSPNIETPRRMSLGRAWLLPHDPIQQILVNLIVAGEISDHLGGVFSGLAFRDFPFDDRTADGASQDFAIECRHLGA